MIDMATLETIEDASLFRLAGVSITAGGLVSAAVILAVTVTIAWVATRAIRRVRDRSTRNAGTLYLLEKLTSYGVTVVGVILALSAAGVNLSSLAVFAGAIGIGVGLGLQGWSRSSSRACS